MFSDIKIFFHDHSPKWCYCPWPLFWISVKVSFFSIDMKTKVAQNIQTFIHSWFPAFVLHSDIFLLFHLTQTPLELILFVSILTFPKLGRSWLFPLHVSDNVISVIQKSFSQIKLLSMSIRHVLTPEFPPRPAAAVFVHIVLGKMKPRPSRAENLF